MHKGKPYFYLKISTMTKQHLTIALTLLILLFPAKYALSQETSDTTKIWVVDTRDGQSFIGSITSENSEEIVLLTDNYGTIHIPRAQIKKIKLLSGSDMKEGEYWFKNPHDTRYFVMSNGFGLEQGEAYYQNTWILFNQINYGITDFFSMGAGVLPLFLFAGAPTPVFITPKLTVPVVKEKVNLGAGMLLGYVLGETASFGIAHGAATFGNRDNNLTLGAGWAFVDWDWAENPTISLSGMVRVSRKTYLLTENYYIGISEGEAVVLIALGGRSVQRRLAIDYGLVIPLVPDMDTFFAIPWLGIAVPFGNTN